MSAKVSCANCDGSGEVCVHRHGDGYEDEYAPCPDCGGEGEIEDDRPREHELNLMNERTAR